MGFSCKSFVNQLDAPKRHFDSASSDRVWLPILASLT